MRTENQPMTYKAGQRAPLLRLATGWCRRLAVIFLMFGSMAIISPAQTFTTLFSFDGTDGSDPVYASLVQGLDGNLYGTTSEGGNFSGGTVLEITPGGELTTLYNFCEDCTDGSVPSAGLVLATNGNFYGTTFSGGVGACFGYGCGTVFEITPAGDLTTLHDFDGTDGYWPSGGLIQAANGNFYGMTGPGGDYGDGTVFEMTPTGKLTTLHSFEGTDGSFPNGALVQGTDGNFYGTTNGGGTNGTDAGTVFKITPGGTLTTLYNFCSQSGCADGSAPAAGLIQATDGNFYGTTEAGGTFDCGVVFEITPAGNLTALQSFGGDGCDPEGALVQATDRNFYGTTYNGGTYGLGTVFRITREGTITTLHSFEGAGGNPNAGLVQATSGILYGTTPSGGTDNAGTVFSLSIGLKPFVQTNPTSGAVGAKVTILGNNLTGSTGVTFDGTAATFTVSKSGTYISTTVPSGATTGNVEVTTATGATLTSNVEFRVP
jgi:uncharacterized repeat protein (TIGR03803 family)